ncbi:Alpha/beta hydrolase fold [Trema orientale]|uniref:Alpha/beta hydrolase fold n=1 Tax=Trema orientale TaxID=63057 RepID=A0A2P5EK79_TREOI|nr:Alpha/beta hydrolase fold [Trema orientale]
MPPAIFSGKWPLNPATKLLSALSFLVFLVLDFLDTILCLVYRFIDEFFEGQSSMCYCRNREEKRGSGMEDDEDEGEDEDEDEGELSETLFGRKNVFREMGFLGFSGKLENSKKRESGEMGSRWSDCGCESCLSWMTNGDHKLHCCIREPSNETLKETNEKPAENVIFLHGFLSSSSLWTETVFPNQSESVKCKYRLFAIDLLGFGRSPKPRDCFYTLKNHLEMIEKSVISQLQLDSFHLVAHSMGCIIAMALAAKHPKSVKSITLVAPPVFPSKFGGLRVLEKLAERRLWPPLLFGSAVMSWYEHIGRSVCLLLCRNHRAWEKILKLISRRTSLHFMTMDLTRHTHHSAWHSMHNVICGGTKLMESCFKILTKARVRICVIQGDQDQVVPMECSDNVKTMAPNAEVNIIRGANHSTIILGREREFTRYLEHIWASLADS